MFKKWKPYDTEMVIYLLSSSSNENTNTCLQKTKLMSLTSFSECNQKIPLVINYHLGIKISVINSLPFMFHRFLCIHLMKACFILPVYLSIPLLFKNIFCFVNEGIQSVANYLNNGSIVNVKINKS